MYTILRSLLNITIDNKATIENAYLIENYKAYKTSGVEQKEVSYQKIFSFIDQHYKQYEDLPAVELLIRNFEKEGDENCLATLKQAIAARPVISSSFKSLLAVKNDEQQKDKFKGIVQAGWEVIQKKGLVSGSDFIVNSLKKLKNDTGEIPGLEDMEEMNNIQTDSTALGCLIDQGLGKRGLFRESSVSLIAGMSHSGKTVLMIFNIVKALLYNGTVFGQYKIRPETKMLYFNSDMPGKNFIDNFLANINYKTCPNKNNFLMVPTMDWYDKKITFEQLLGLVEEGVERGFNWIVLDNQSSMFPGTVWSQKAPLESVDLFTKLKLLASKHRIHITVLQHLTKLKKQAWELMTIDDLLGTARYVADQIIGIEPRYDAKDAGQGKKKTFYPRQGNGIINPLKNVELPYYQFTLYRDETTGMMEIGFDPPGKKIVEDDEPEIFTEEQQTKWRSQYSMVYNFVKENKNTTYGDICANLKISLVTVHKHIKKLEDTGQIDVNRTVVGRGHNAKITFLHDKTDILGGNNASIKTIPMDCL